MRYRHAWPGVLLLGALAVLLVSLLVWGDHFLSPGPAGGIRRLLDPQQPKTAQGGAAEVLGAEDPRATAAAAPAADLPDGVADAPSSPEASPRVAGAGSKAVASPSSHALYALDLGTFALEEEAERVEVQLNIAGLSTVRFRQQAPARLYSVTLRRLDEAVKPPAAPEPAGRGAGASPGEAGGAGTAVKIARALPLRSAVALAERLRSAGYETRVIAEDPRQGQVVLRHGNFASAEEALVVSRRVAQLGVQSEVIRVR